MKIDRENLQKIAHLARLDFEEDGAREMIESMTEILDWVEKLNELNTEGVDPLTNMAAEQNILREDVAKQTLSHECGLKNAPKKDADYFRVPKVLE